jgi:hypothetical protein
VEKNSRGELADQLKKRLYIGEAVRQYYFFVDPNGIKVKKPGIFSVENDRNNSSTLNSSSKKEKSRLS